MWKGSLLRSHGEFWWELKFEYHYLSTLRINREREREIKLYFSLVKLYLVNFKFFIIVIFALDILFKRLYLLIKKCLYLVCTASIFIYVFTINNYIQNTMLELNINLINLIILIILNIDIDIIYKFNVTFKGDHAWLEPQQLSSVHHYEILGFTLQMS